MKLFEKVLTGTKTSLLFALCSLLFVMGCSTREADMVAATVDHDFINAFEAVQMARQPTMRTTHDTVAVSGSVWLGDTSTVLEHRNRLPAEFETDTGITIVLAEPVSLQVLANNIFSMTGIPVRIDNQINSERLRRHMNIAYTGSLSGLLSQVATDLDLLWYFDRNAIVFYETETRTYTLFALGTDISFQSRMATDDGNVVSMESNLHEWQEIERSIQSIIAGSDAARFTVSRSFGTITVTAPPSVHVRVADYINRQNRRLSQLVAIDVKVLQVSITNQNQMGINLTAAIQNAAGLQLVGGNNPGGIATGAANLGVAVVSQGATGTTGNFAGSQALIQALASQGQISLVTNVGVTTRNNRVAPITNMRSTGYIRRIESRNFTTIESTSVEQSEIETGFSMQILPNVLENRRILMMFRMSIRELIDMDTRSFGSTAEGSIPMVIQMPVVEERSFMQEVIMESGQMLVLSGFERQENRDTRQGIGNPDFIALGGLRDTQAARDVLVVILTPQILVSPMDAERGIQQNWGAPLH